MTNNNETILSTDAVIFDINGFITSKGVTVAKITDSDGDTFIRINGTLHLDRDILEEEDGSLTLLSNGGKMIL